MKPITLAGIVLAAPIIAAAQYNGDGPSYGTYQGSPYVGPSGYGYNGYQSGMQVDSGIGLLIIGAAVYFLFIKKKKGGSE